MTDWEVFCPRCTRSITSSESMIRKEVTCKCGFTWTVGVQRGVVQEDIARVRVTEVIRGVQKSDDEGQTRLEEFA